MVWWARVMVVERGRGAGRGKGPLQCTGCAMMQACVSYISDHGWQHWWVTECGVPVFVCCRWGAVLPMRSSTRQRPPALLTCNSTTYP